MLMYRGIWGRLDPRQLSLAPQESQSVLLLREGPQQLQRSMGTRLTRGLAKAAQGLSSKPALVVAVVVVVGLLRADHFPQLPQKL